MSLRIWLNARGVKELGPPVSGRADILKAAGQETRVDAEGTNKYAGTMLDVMDPSTLVPRVLHRYVKHVSYVGKWFEGFRADGIYYDRGATARVETVVELMGFRDNRELMTFQKISIRAGSVSGIRKIYSKIRLAQLEPVEPWGLTLDKVKTHYQSVKAPPAH